MTCTVSETWFHRYERLLQWRQNRSKATMWLLYKIPAIRGCPTCF